MAELNDVNAINVELVLDLDSFSSGSYWVYNQPTDSVAGASTSIYLGVDTFLLTTVVPEGQTLDSALLAHYQSAYSYSTLDSTLFNGDVVTYHYAEFIDDAYDAYFIDTLFYRGSYEASYYLATYTSTCTAELIKTDYINGFREMKKMNRSINIDHVIYLPGIDSASHKIDGSVRLYYGAVLSVNTNDIEFSGYQTVNFEKGKISEIWEWSDYGGVSKQLQEYIE